MWNPQRSQNDYFQTNLFLLGCQIEVNCKYVTLKEDIENYFPHFINERNVTPDVVIYCEWERSNKYLFRARPEKFLNEHLEGVYFKLPGKKIEQWRNLNPPLPPNSIPPFKDRFVGLHAGAVVNNLNQATLLIGPRGSGKTTTTSQLVNTFGHHLLTDETVYIHKRTSIIEPFLREIRARVKDHFSGEIKKQSKNVNEMYKSVYKKAVPAIQGVFLEPSNRLGIYKIDDEEDILKRLISNHRDVGCNNNESLYTLSLLSKELRFYVFNYRDYQELISNGIEKLFEEIGSNSIIQ